MRLILFWALQPFNGSKDSPGSRTDVGGAVARPSAEIGTTQSSLLLLLLSGSSRNASILPSGDHIGLLALFGT